jgi:hypothetical protein
MYLYFFVFSGVRVYVLFFSALFLVVVLLFVFVSMMNMYVFPHVGNVRTGILIFALIWLRPDMSL